MYLRIDPYHLPSVHSKSVPTTPKEKRELIPSQTSAKTSSSTTDELLRRSVPIVHPINDVFKAIISEDRVSDTSLHVLNFLSQTQRREISIRLITDAENFKNGIESVGASLLLSHPGLVANFFPEAATTIHKQDTDGVFELKTHVQNYSANTKYSPTVRPDLHRDVAKTTITQADRSRIATDWK